MGVNRPTIPILGIILAISSLVLGAFTFTVASRIDSQVTNYFAQNSWYRYTNETFNTNPSATYITLPSLMVQFDLEQGESVYFSFSCSAHLESAVSATHWSRIFVYFKVDGLFDISDPNAEVGMYSITVTHHFVLHLQIVRADLFAGVHNVTVVIYGTSTGNYIFESSLFVQKVAI